MMKTKSFNRTQGYTQHLAEGEHGIAAAVCPGKSRYLEPIPPRLARNTIVESTFGVGRRYRRTLRVDCGQIDPSTVVEPVPGECHPRMPERLDEEDLSDWRARRNALYQLAALAIGAWLASRRITVKKISIKI
jgi:hypothetical protein